MTVTKKKRKTVRRGKEKTIPASKPLTEWRIYGGPDSQVFVGKVYTEAGEDPKLIGMNEVPGDFGVMFEAHRSPPVLRGPSPRDERQAAARLGPAALQLYDMERQLRPIAEFFDNATGMRITPRDLFALAALMGDTTMRSHGDQAARAYLVADAMLKERARVKEAQGERSEFDPGPNS